MSGDDQERRRVGLCADCTHARRLVSAKSSVFWRCGFAEHDRSFRDYPPLPVHRCTGFADRAATTSDGEPCD